jgi:hypothetical protein
MTFLPIVARELRVAARRPFTYWMRFFAAFGVMLIWLLLLMTNRRLTTAQRSLEIFTSFGILAFAFCLLAGLFLTADCLSEEKREGTLGLLFLTDLKGYDVVLGKLLATSLHSVYGVLAILPVLALPVLMGGVTVGEFWRVVLALLVTLFLSLSLGMFVSAFQHETRPAIAATFLGILLLTGVCPALWWMWSFATRVSPPTWLMSPSPAWAFTSAFDAYHRTRIGPRDFWGSIALLGTLGFSFLAIAAGVLPNIWQQKRTVKADSPPQPPGNGRQEPRVAAGRCGDTSPFFWLASRGKRSRGVSYAAVGILLVLWVCFLVLSVSRIHAELPFIVCLFVSYALHQVFKYDVAVEASRQLGEDKRSGALELMLVTPLKEAEIIADQRRALLFRFRPFAKGLSLLNLLLCATVVICDEQLRMDGEVQAVFVELFLGGILMLWLDFQTIAVVGMRTALRAKTHNRAISGTIGRTMLVPWGAIFLLFALMSGAPMSRGGVGAIFALWFTVGIFTDLFLLGQAHGALRQGFRTCMAEPVRTGLPVPLGQDLRPQQV